MEGTTTAPTSNPITIRLEILNKVGMLGRVTSTIGEAGGSIGAVDLVSIRRNIVTRDITFFSVSEEAGEEIVRKLRSLKDVRVINASDRILLLHLGGKIEVQGKVPLKTRDELAIAYTPGVAKVSLAIYQDPKAAWALTSKRNTVAVVTDGTAVLGLGDIGPAAALPVMEGKALLFKEFANVDAWPICLETKDPEEIIQTVKHLSPGFGGINLEDISAPRCFTIEERLREELDIPVFHDDQHGTAVVVMAALLNALKLVRKELSDLKIVIAGVGAAGVASARFLMAAGVQNIIGVDRAGVVYERRAEDMNFMKDWFAQHTNPAGIQGALSEAMEGADVFLGLSAPGILRVEHLTKMNRDPIVFAMANPVPEIMPDEAAPYVRIMATGRSDFANQVNNVLCFPGLFRGALDVQASTINEAMKLAAAEAIAGTISRRELQEDYIIPGVFNRNIVPAVARAVAKAARATGVARRHAGARAT